MKWIYPLFNRMPRKRIMGALPAGGAPGGGGDGPAGAFITTQSLVTFPGATGAISLVWGFINSIVEPSQANKKIIGAAICLAVGALIYAINVSDPNTPPTKREKLIGVPIAILNTIVLYMASFGITTAAGH